MTQAELHENEEGALATEAALLLPLAFFVLFVIVQFGLWMYATIGVNQAATHAVQTLAVTGGNHSDPRELATEAAYAVLSDVNGVQEPWVNAGFFGPDPDRPTHVHVHVRGQAAILLPGFEGRVEARKRAPVERFMNVCERGGC